MSGRRPANPPAYPPSGTSWPLPILRVEDGRQLFRITRVHHEDPAYYGCAGTERFDAPDRSFSICYLGTSLDCCLLEVLSARLQPSGRRFTTLVDLNSYYAAIAMTVRPIHPAHLSGDSLAHCGIDLRVPSGDDYDLSQAWSKAIHGHQSSPDGIFYTSRRNDLLHSVALFDRARHAVQFEKWGRLGDPDVPGL